MATALEPALELASDCTDAQLLLAQQSLNSSDYEGCTMATGRVLKIHSSHTEALLLRASAFFKLAVRSPMPFHMHCPFVSACVSLGGHEGLCARIATTCFENSKCSAPC